MDRDKVLIAFLRSVADDWDVCGPGYAPGAALLREAAERLARLACTDDKAPRPREAS
jgi:hypothetical protein